MLRVLAVAVVLFTVACGTEPYRSYWFIESYHDGVLKARLDEGPGKVTTYIAACDGENPHSPILKISRITETHPAEPRPGGAIGPPQLSPALPIPDQTIPSCDIVAGFVGKGILVENQERDSDGPVVITILTTGGEPGGGYPGDSLILHGKRGAFSETFRIVSVTR